MSDIKIIQNSDTEVDSVPKNYSKGYLAIPFEGEQFKEFIQGLLGKPQLISKPIIGNYVVFLKDLQNLHDLINQRVTQQNAGKLLQFTCKIHFNDDSYIQLGSYEELVTYNEIRPLSSTGVVLSWDYLIQFPDKSYPEKQEIEIAFNRKEQYLSSRELTLYRYGGIVINIRHTARSWGLDIENMLTHQLESVVEKDSKLRRFLLKYEAEVSIVSVIIFFLSSLISAFVVTGNFINREIQYVTSFTQKPSTTYLQKIDFIGKYIATGSSSLHYFKVGIFILISLIISIFLGIWISQRIGKLRGFSFVILTKKAQERYSRYLEMSKKNMYLVAVSFIASIATKVITSLVFKLLAE